MSKLSISFKDTGFKGFLAHHIEKVALGVAFLVLALLFATGYTTDTIKPDQTPVKLKSIVQQARVNIDRPENWDIIQEEFPVDLNHSKRVDTSRAPTKPVLYAATVPLNNQGVSPTFIKRPDPTLFPPVKVEVEPFYGVLAIQARTNAPDKLLQSSQIAMTNPDDEKKNKPKPKKKKKPKVASGEGMLAPMPMSIDPEGEPGLEMLDTPDTPQPRMLSGAMRRELTEQDPELRITGSGMYGLYAVAVKALVPLESQSGEFDKAFAKAEGYDEGRDSPEYIDFEVSRADVSELADGAEVPEEAWRLIGNRAGAAQLEGFYAVRTEERVDLKHYDPNLTSMAPPILQRDLTSLFLHSETEKAKDPSLEPKEAVGPGIGEFDLVGDSSAPRRGPGGTMNDMASIEPQGMAGMGGVENLPQERGKYLLVRFYDTRVTPGHKYQYRVRVKLSDPNFLGQRSNRSSYGGGGQPGMEGGAGGMIAPRGGGSMNGGSSTSLSERMLEETVVARLKKQASADAAVEGQITDWITSPWSKASGVANVPKKPERLLAGAATPPSMWSVDVGNREVSFPYKEPTAQLVASIWDKSLTVDVPAEQEVMRGSFLNFKATPDVVHPTKMVILRLNEPYNFDLDAMVLDIQGGERLPRGDRDDPLTAPSRMLLVDRDGNLIVRDEVEDMVDYRQLMIIEEDIPGANPNGGGGLMEGGGIPMDPMGGGLLPPGL